MLALRLAVGEQQTCHMLRPLGEARQRKALVGCVRGRILIANLSKGRLGADKANLLGAILVTQFQLAAMSRA